MSFSEKQRLVGYTGSRANRQALEWCGQTLAAGRDVDFLMPNQSGTLAEIQQQIIAFRPTLIITDWPNAEYGENWLRFALQQNLSVVFLRWPEFTKIKRVLILSAGGIHIARQLWIAQKTAETYGCPAQILQVLQTSEMTNSETAAATSLQAKMLGINTPVKVAYANDVLSGLAGQVEDGDLLILGAPNHWRLSTHFSSSLSDQIAKHFSNPMMMLLGHRPEKIRLRETFWPLMINPGLSAVSREDAIAQLIDCLIRNNQAPQNWRKKLLQLALAREQGSSTAVGCETAFPHIMMPIKGGLAGCMGIFPQGVDFHASDQSLINFVFLFITPDNYYSEYLDILSLLSEKLISTEVRQHLLGCQTGTEVLAVLDPEISA